MADFSIASQIRPMQLPDPLQQYAQFNQLALHQAQLAEVQRTAQEQNQLRQLSASGVNLLSPEGIKQAFNVSPALGLKMTEEANKLKTSGLNQELLTAQVGQIPLQNLKAQGEVDAQKQAAMAADHKLYSEMLNKVLALPDDQAKTAYEMLRAGAVSKYKDLDAAWPRTFEGNRGVLEKQMLTAEQAAQKQAAATLAAQPQMGVGPGGVPVFGNKAAGTFVVGQDVTNAPPAAGAPFAPPAGTPTAVMRQPAAANAPATGAAPAAAAPADLASNLLRRFEGFRETPYYDVNAYRTGYGSDTITQADGKVIKVQPGMQITKEDAERDLSRRLNNEFIPKATMQVGAENWTALPAPAQAALASVAYNYGSLPSSVVAAVKTNDVNAIADAVQALKDNPGRRAQEAAVIRGNGLIQSSPTVPSMTMGQQFAVPGSVPGGMNALAPLAGVPAGGFNNLATPAPPQLVAPPAMPVAGAPAAAPRMDFAALTAQTQQRAIEQKAAETTAVKTAELQVKARDTLPKLEEATRTIQDTLNQMIGNAKVDAKGNVVEDKNAPLHPGFGQAVGFSTSKLIAPNTPFAGTSRADFEALFKQVQGGAFLEAYDALRGAGGIALEEGRKATEAKNAMSLATSEAGFIKAANNYRDALTRGLDIMRKQAAGGAAPTAAATPANDAAPVAIKNDQEYNALTKGTLYTAPDGSVRRKQ